MDLNPPAGENYAHPKTCLFHVIFKNVSGRILVGLRWWNEINDLGESVWKFESLDQESLARMNKKDSWLFWWTLYLTMLSRRFNNLLMRTLHLGYHPPYSQQYSVLSDSELFMGEVKRECTCERLREVEETCTCSLYCPSVRNLTVRQPTA
ncbi:uncharacterized protein LOC122318804 isoform X3 [Carya illinoinensis]|uniref:uncharacterized protein LOC122318804 isoform X3 n=1 Tax=Carya illinoinensis TaxID=32201 RepID=UPI001C71BDD4|nr:uncharacterized protein LOC122318804 isoform X3 [Carya illinoinensis]